MLKQYRLKNYHFQLVVYIIALSIIGILLIGSAKHSVQSKQIIGFVMGLTIMIVLSLIDYSFLLKFVWIYYAVMIVLLLLVLFAGDDAKGAQDGSKYIAAINREACAQGPSQDVSNKLSAGSTYVVSAWVKYDAKDAVDSKSFNMTIQNGPNYKYLSLIHI